MTSGAKPRISTSTAARSGPIDDSQSSWNWSISTNSAGSPHSLDTFHSRRAPSPGGITRPTMEAAIHRANVHPAASLDGGWRPTSASALRKRISTWWLSITFKSAGWEASWTSPSTSIPLRRVRPRCGPPPLGKSHRQGHDAPRAVPAESAATGSDRTDQFPFGQHDKRLRRQWRAGCATSSGGDPRTRQTASLGCAAWQQKSCRCGSA